MAKTFRPWDVDQLWLLPPSVNDLVPADHVAHFVRETVRTGLDLSAIYAKYTGERGQPPFHPAMMTALLLYAYSQGVYASRKIAQACETRVDFMAVTGRQMPDFRTISEFRKRHLAALHGLFVQVLALCREAGLVKLGHVALDGTKVKANASKHKAMSYGRMRIEEPKLAAKVQQWLAAAAQADKADDREHGADKRGDEMPAWAADPAKRLEKIRAAKAALEAEAKDLAEHDDDAPPPGGEPPTPAEERRAAERRRMRRRGGAPEDKAQRNFTDPDSRIMKGRDGFVQAYNAQIVVDAAAQVIVAQHLTNHGGDADHLMPLIEGLGRCCDDLPEQLSADAGYCSEANLRLLEKTGIDGYLTPGRQRHGTTDGAGKRRIAPGTRVAAMAEKIAAGGWDSPYRLRKITVEPVFGQIKQGRGFRQFLLRGLDKVRGEWALVCTAHNLLKLAAAR